MRLVANQSGDDLRFLAARDSDPFNRWQAVQSLATRLLVDNVAAIRSGGATRGDDGLLEALAAILADASLEPAFVALALTLAERGRHRARDRPRRRSRRDLRRAHARCATPSASISPPRCRTAIARLTDTEPLPAGRRRRRTPRAAQRLPRPAGRGAARRGAIALAAQQYRDADNMTDRMAALTALSLCDVPERAEAIDDFYERYKDNALIVDKWLALQAVDPGAGDARRA